MAIHEFVGECNSSALHEELVAALPALPPVTVEQRPAGDGTPAGGKVKHKLGNEFSQQDRATIADVIAAHNPNTVSAKDAERATLAARQEAAREELAELGADGIRNLPGLQEGLDALALVVEALNLDQG